MLSKIFNTLEKIASTNERILQANDTMEKAAVTTAGVLTLLKLRKAYINAAINAAKNKNTNLTRQQARNEFYKRYGLQVGEGGHISAVEGAKLSNRALEMQQKWLSKLSVNKSVSSQLKKLRSKAQHGTTSPAAGKPIQTKPADLAQTKSADPAAGKPIQTKPADTAGGKPMQQQTKAPERQAGQKQQQTNTADTAQTKPVDPAPVDAPVGNGLFNNNWWKYGLAGAGGFALGRTTAPNQQPMPIMMPPQPMPAMMYPQAIMHNNMQH